MTYQQNLELIRKTGVIAIMRTQSSEQLLHAAEAIRAGGVCAIEVTMTTPGALSVIEQAAARFDHDVLFGAGTVLDAESARAAILAGAQFVVAPAFKPAVVELCRRYSVPVMPGAYTPTEVIAAWEAGADMVKVFPATVGGPEFIKALRAPLPQIELVPVGGVDVDNTADFIRAGASAVGVGSALINQKLLDAGDFAALTERARKFVQAVACGRAS
ncbi:MAG: bifunctional 4-hydroxy-2-oxoglutarate aldolase/2-dehydro-3-deoxy-phosphogluconate aldolase [Anaerolineae bacterium]|nr:bifunctional 4-hydroxy-2-oxoglutarate aldolase/2-dehydro-3-deoxy-phosphogluconate aldolase [Anaerolineae bacterium]